MLCVYVYIYIYIYIYIYKHTQHIREVGVKKEYYK
jgi:hypothetical protein